MLRAGRGGSIPSVHVALAVARRASPASSVSHVADVIGALVFLAVVVLLAAWVSA